jgi:hypothetical protein
VIPSTPEMLPAPGVTACKPMKDPVKFKGSGGVITLLSKTLFRSTVLAFALKCRFLLRCVLSLYEVAEVIGFSVAACKNSKGLYQAVQFL